MQLGIPAMNPLHDSSVAEHEEEREKLSQIMLQYRVFYTLNFYSFPYPYNARRQTQPLCNPMPIQTPSTVNSTNIQPFYLLSFQRRRITTRHLLLKLRIILTNKEAIPMFPIRLGAHRKISPESLNSLPLLNTNTQRGIQSLQFRLAHGCQCSEAHV